MPTIATKNTGTILWGISSVILYLLIGYYINRAQSVLLITIWLLLFAGYAYIITRSWSDKKVKQLIIVAILFRALFLLATPSLSDDYFRYIWDGSLINTGINPFQFIPADIQTHNQELYSNLNSPHYYAVYPPVMQAVFAVAEYCSGGNTLVAVIIMRVFLLLAEVGTFYVLIALLKHWHIPATSVLIYALNPLIIIELTGNLHFEALMLFFFSLSFLLLMQNRLVLSAVFFAFSVCTKLLPLILLPLLIKHLGYKRFFVYTAVVAATFILLFAPFISTTLITNIFNSIELYFQHFEFNASIYYISRAVGYYITGYNSIAIIGKLLPAVFILIAVAYLYKYRAKTQASFFVAGLWLSAIYYFLALVVHPWYLSIMILCAAFTNCKFPLVWSAVVVLSYTAYQGSPYHENLLLITIEYLLVFFVLYCDFKHNTPATTLQ